MSHWILDNLEEPRRRALEEANRAQIRHELLSADSDMNDRLIRRAAEGLELAVLSLALENIEDDESKQSELKLAAADAFRLYRMLPKPDDALEAGIFLLRANCLAVLGDKGSDAARWMKENPWPELPVGSDDWGKRTWATVIDAWLRLIRKDGWGDRDKVLEHVTRLRDAQAELEKSYLDNLEPAYAMATALELIGLYHLAKAAEIFAHYITDGAVESKYQIHQSLDSHFNHVFDVCQQARLIDLEPISRLLAASAVQMVENSIGQTTKQSLDLWSNESGDFGGSKATSKIAEPKPKISN